MGIRFTCPQGHPLNVKSELAGKRGVCPQCGAKVQIPADSLPPPGRTGVGAEAEVAAPVVEAVKEIAKPQAAVEAAPPQLAVAAVEEAWYVRPPGGGQFGPASAADFGQWIREGRVLPEAYVWRAGWTDWRLASEAAAALPVPLPAAPVAVPLPSAEPIAAPAPEMMVVPQTLPSAKRTIARRKRSAQRQLRIAIVLLILVVILSGVLIWVLQREPAETAQMPGCSPPCDVLG